MSDHSYRMLKGTFCLVAFVLVNSYTCNFISYLTVIKTKPSVNSFEDLTVAQDVRLIVEKDSVIHDTLMVSRRPFAHQSNFWYSIRGIASTHQRMSKRSKSLFCARLQSLKGSIWYFDRNPVLERWKLLPRYCGTIRRMCSLPTRKDGPNWQADAMFLLPYRPTFHSFRHFTRIICSTR